MTHRLWIACASATLLSYQPATAMSPSVRDVATIQDEMKRGSFQGRTAWAALGTYFQGAMESLGMTQQALEQRGAAGVFCPPRGTSLSMQDVYESLDRAAHRGETGSALKAVLTDLQRQYPCAP